MAFDGRSGLSGDILIVDDDAPLREVVRYALEREGFRVREAADGVEALTSARGRPPDLIVLDVAMPHLDGLSVCRALRADPDGGPAILFLTARDDEVDRVLGLELGGDDYVTKPFSPRELASRVKAVLRRTRPAAAAPSHQVESRGLKLDAEQRRVWSGGAEIALTATEFALLHALLRRPTKVFTRDELVEHAYGVGHHVSDRTIDSHLRRVREKLRAVGCDAVDTVHGVGFRLDPS
jgi:two-component system OmpR family response regulator